jgi:hypothetical protein
VVRIWPDPDQRQPAADSGNADYSTGHGSSLHALDSAKIKRQLTFRLGYLVWGINARGLERWTEMVDGAVTWFARIELDDQQTTTDLAKTEYDAAGCNPPFWELPKRKRSYSSVVNKGMTRLCKDFSDRIVSSGFRKTGRRLWTRINAWSVESIHLHRSGCSYGAPYNASVDIRVMLGMHVLNAPMPGPSIVLMSDPIRRRNGCAYHHRFNAETWSTYDRCVDELALFVNEVAEPWFAEWREPQKLMTHSELPASTRKLLAEAVAGHANPASVAASLEALGVKVRHPKA